MFLENSNEDHLDGISRSLLYVEFEEGFEVHEFRWWKENYLEDSFQRYCIFLSKSPFKSYCCNLECLSLFLYILSFSKKKIIGTRWSNASSRNSTPSTKSTLKLESIKDQEKGEDITENLPEKDKLEKKEQEKEVVVGHVTSTSQQTTFNAPLDPEGMKEYYAFGLINIFTCSLQ